MARLAGTGRLNAWRRPPGSECHGWHPHMLRHPSVTTMLDADELCDVQIAADHADPRTTMRADDRARKTLDRQPNDILAAYKALRNVTVHA